MYYRYCPCPGRPEQQFALKDYGPEPLVVPIQQATMRNCYFRTALWTGEHLQVVLMSLKAGEEIGLEVHPSVDQFIRIESGQGMVKMGNAKDNLTLVKRVGSNDAILVPAGTWHNIINIGNYPLKLYTIYAPPEHPRGTIHKTKEEAQKAEQNT
jgi:mannose-6-phosphate isomerase-like protein (cupin superfamily)